MECSPDKIACLLAWCSTHGIHMDPRLEIVEKGETGISVFSRDAQIRDPAVRKCNTSLILIHIS